MRRGVRTMAAAMTAMALLAGAPADAQFSDSYKFLKAVRDRDGTKVTEVVDQPGGTLLNARGDDGDGALHIVARRRDSTWLAFLLGKGARPDLKNNAGDTPLGLASQIGFSDGVSLLLANGAGVNVANGRGETPLILAVQAHDAGIVRQLLTAGADPSLSDRVAGLSARDYAERDRRSAAILKLIDETKATKPKGAIAGPRL